MSKLISIIIPCYNAESYIDRCFHSILSQTIGFDKLEVILVDDCSTDHTWEILTAIEAAYPESVMIIHCDENGHQGTARNIGMEYASAPYITFLDSDDWIEPDMYEKLYEKIVTYQCDIAMCQDLRDPGNISVTPEDRLTGASNRILQIDTIDKRKTFLVCSSIGYGPCNKLYTRELLYENHIRFPDHLAYEDPFFCMFLYFYANRIYILEERLYHYFINPLSTTLKPDAAHHLHILDADILLWAECESRDFLNIYRQELEYQFLCLCYLSGLKMMSLRLSEPPYDFFLRLKEETLKRVPNYHANPYIKDYVTEFNQALLQTLELPISEQDLQSICSTIRQKTL